MNADDRSPLAEDQVGLVVEVFRMLADPTRVQVLWALADNELSVNELASRVGKPGPSVSQHLAKLRSMDLVSTRRDRQMIYYSCKSDEAVQLLRALDNIFGTAEAT